MAEEPQDPDSGEDEPANPDEPDPKVIKSGAL
jgi:hypothetical protein